MTAQLTSGVGVASIAPRLRLVRSQLNSGVRWSRTVTTDHLDTNRILERFLADAVATLGECARAEALTRAGGVTANVRALMQRFDAGGG